MSRLWLLLLTLPVFLQAQYYNERAMDQNFENRSFHWNSYYLNTSAIGNFAKVSQGLIDDPYLNLSLNPAWQTTDSLSPEFIISFRGAREREYEETGYIVPARNYYIDQMSIYPIPQYIQVETSEPEPIFIAGTRMPLLGNKLQLTAAYQYTYDEGPYYTMPYYIYYGYYGYNAFDEKVSDLAPYPETQRSAGSDELFTEAQAGLVYLNTRLTDKLTIGLGVNFVAHDKDGNYGNLYRYNYPENNDYNYFQQSQEERKDRYEHIDLQAGAMLGLSREWSAGARVGQLTARLSQSVNRIDTSFYSSENTNYEYYNNRSATDLQNWDRDGFNRYGNFQLIRHLPNGARFIWDISGGWQEADLKTAGNIADSAWYYSGWEYDSSGWHEGESVSTLFDNRQGTGRQKRDYRASRMNLQWPVSEHSRISLGLHLRWEKNNSRSTEPVQNHRLYRSDYDNYEYIYDLREVKTIYWEKTEKYRLFSIPVLLEHRFGQAWTICLGVNRIVEYWDIKEENRAAIDLRRETYGQEINEKKNFMEVYTLPAQRISENRTDMMAGIKVNIAPGLRVELIADPEIGADFFMNQWWLNFHYALGR